MSTDPDQIKADIERTRAELSSDVDALTDKVTPSRIVERRVDSAKGALASVKERVMGTVHQSSSSTSSAASSGVSMVGDKASSAASTAGDKVSSAASSASSAVQSAPSAVMNKAEGNPLAAGLIAFGVGWLASSLLPATQRETQLAGSAKDLAMEHKDALTAPLADAAQQAQDALREPAMQAVDSVKSSAQDAVSTVKEQGQSSVSDVTSQASDAKDTVAGTRSGSSSESTGWAGNYQS